MEHKQESEYEIERDNNQIIAFDENLLKKANRFFEVKYSDESKIVEGYKEAINLFYSHANIFSAEYNMVIIEGRVKLLIFDSYFDDYIREIFFLLIKLFV